jgi:transposase InsO family protein
MIDPTAKLSVSRQSVVLGIGRSIGFYNSRRPHSSLDGRTPDQPCFNPSAPEAAAA